VGHDFGNEWLRRWNGRCRIEIVVCGAMGGNPHSHWREFSPIAALCDGEWITFEEAIWETTYVAVWDSLSQDREFDHFFVEARGGGWWTIPKHLVSSYFIKVLQGDRDRFTGFRCARDVHASVFDTLDSGGDLGLRINEKRDISAGRDSSGCSDGK